MMSVPCAIVLSHVAACADAKSLHTNKTKSTGAPVKWMAGLRKLKCCSV